MPATASSDRAPERIDAFVRDLGWQRRLWVVLDNLLGTVIWVAPAVILLWILLPEALPKVLWCAAACLVLRLIYGAIRHQLWRPLPARGRYPLLAVDRSLGLGDRLATWRTGHGSGAMHGWLEKDLADELGRVPPDRARAIWGKRVKRMVRWLPLILLLVLLKLCAPFVPGLRNRGGATPGTTESADGQGEGEADYDGHQPSEQSPKGDPADDPAGDTGEQPKPQTPMEPVPEVGADPGGDERQEPVPPRPPRPLDDSLGRQEEFVVPDYVGDGETRRQMAQQAELEMGGALPPPSRAQPSGLPSDPEARAQELERAAEKAVRSRHVPATERPFVKNWFDAVRRKQ